jgi:ketosteroid isomerase-like protein
MVEHPNVALVRRGLEEVARGELDAVLALWADEFVYYAFDSVGPPAEVTSREEFVNMMVTGRKMSVHSYEILDLRAVGQELVVAHMRVHMTATKTAESTTGDYLGVYRISEGKIVMGCDFVDGGLQQFLDGVWSA